MARAIQIECLLSGFSDGAGAPYSGGSITVYDEGTSDLATIYTKADKSIEASNPVTLDTFGSIASPIFSAGNVKIVLKDSGGSTIKIWDELSYSLGNFDVEHNSDGSHLAGFLVNSYVHASAAIAISKIANLTDEHNVGGSHKDVKYGGGGMYGRLQTLTNSVIKGFNCYWTGSEWSAYDATKNAAVFDLDTTDGQLYIKWKTDTSSNWAESAWDEKKSFFQQVSFDVSRSSDQTINQSSWLKIAWTSEDKDSNDNFSSNRFTPTVKSRYSLTAAIQFTSTLADGVQVFISIYKNGAELQTSSDTIGAAGIGACMISCDVEANGTTDYFEVYVFHDDTVPRDVSGDKTRTFFQGHRIL